jgi:NDP-sugar pyrophosphorylase family protein
VLHARRYLEGCGHFLIHNVDVFSNADLNWFREQVRPDAVATLMVSDRKSSRSFLFQPETMLLVGWKNNVTGEVILADGTLKEEDCLAFPFSGIHIMSDKVFDLMDRYVAEKGLQGDEATGIRFPIVDFYLWTMKKAPIYGALSNDLKMLDVGKMDTLSQAEDMLKKF